MSCFQFQYVPYTRFIIAVAESGNFIANFILLRGMPLTLALVHIHVIA